MASTPVPHTRYVDLARNPGAIDTLARGTFCLGVEVSPQAFAAALGPRAEQGALIDATVLGGDSALRRLLADDALFKARCGGLISGRPFTFITQGPDLKTVAALGFLRLCASRSVWAGTIDADAIEVMRPHWRNCLARLRQIANNDQGLVLPEKILATYRETGLTFEACVDLVVAWTDGGLTSKHDLPLDVAIQEANQGWLDPLYTQLERSIRLG